MKELTDNELIALGLREHAQTCDEIALRHSNARSASAYKRRADRCRDLAIRYEAAVSVEKPRNLA